MPTKLQQSRLSDVRPAAEMGPGSGWIRNEQTGEVVSIDGSGNVSMRDRDGNPIQRTTGRLGSVPPEQANPDGVQRVGNMDVTFAPETTAAQKQAFLTDPVKPEGQMIQYNNRALAEADRQEFNRNKEQNGMPELLTRENAPDMGWKSRQAINNQDSRDGAGKGNGQYYRESESWSGIGAGRERYGGGVSTK